MFLTNRVIRHFGECGGDDYANKWLPVELRSQTKRNLASKGDEITPTPSSFALETTSISTSSSNTIAVDPRAIVEKDLVNVGVTVTV